MNILRTLLNANFPFSTSLEMGELVIIFSKSMQKAAERLLADVKVSDKQETFTLAELRKCCGLTQKQLGDMIGVTREHVSVMERSGITTIEKVFAISKALEDYDVGAKIDVDSQSVRWTIGIHVTAELPYAEDHRSSSIVGEGHLLI